MTPILRGTLAALALTSTVWLAATRAAADDFETCARASGDQAIAACTRAINSGRYSGRELADLFNNRCAELSDLSFALFLVACGIGLGISAVGSTRVIVGLRQLV